MTKPTLDSDDFDSTPSPYVLFKKFTTKETAKEIAQLLTEHMMDYLLEESALNFDIPGGVNTLSTEYRIKLRKNDFETANQLLDEYSMKQLDQIDKDYPLWSFSDEELMEVLMKPDEWNIIDPLLAKKILKDRGKEVTTAQFAALKEQRIEELSKPDEGHSLWVIVAYVSALLGGLLGIIIGWHLYHQTKMLPNGDRVYSYSARDRTHGRYIMILGVVCMLGWIVYKVMEK